MAQSAPGAAVLMFVLVGIVAFGGFWAVDSAVSGVANETTVEGTVNHTQTWQTVFDTEADRYVGPTASNQSGTLNESAYSWNVTDGSIAFEETVTNQTTGDPEKVNVTATAIAMPSDTSSAIIAMVEPVTRIPAWIILVLGVSIVLAGVRMLNTRKQRGGFP